MGVQLSFSFVVPCLNAENTLGDCLDHIRGQNYPSDLIEILVVDNGSTDRSIEIAEQQADRVLQNTTATIAGLRNFGAAEANNEIVVFVDSDCLLSNEWISRCVVHFEDPQVGMVGAKTHVVPDDAGWVAKAWKVHLDRSTLDPDPQWVVTLALAIRAAVFESIGGFDESLETCEDVTLGHAVRKTHRIISDTHLAPIHLDDPGHLQALYLKEQWRGRDSIQTSINCIKTDPSTALGKEGISLALPFYFLFASLGTAGGLIWWIGGGTSCLLVLSLLALLIPPLTLGFDTCRKTKQMQWLPAVITVYIVYIAARVSALFAAGTSHRKVADG